jgi:hypothetical protein
MDPMQRISLAVAICLTLQVVVGTFVPDTTGLYDRPGEPKFIVEYYKKHVQPIDVPKALVRTIATCHLSYSAPPFFAIILLVFLVMNYCVLP